MKIYHNGRRLNGRFDSIKSFFKRVIRFTFRWSVYAGVLYGAVWAGATFYPSISYATREIEVDVTPKKLEALKIDVIDRLSQCENPKQNDGLIVYDNNTAGSLTGQNIPSIGPLMFKITTVKSSYLALYEKTLTDKEAVEIAMDKEKSYALANDIIFSGKDKKGVDHWHNCNVKLGLAAEVNIIKKLMK